MAKKIEKGLQMKDIQELQDKIEYLEKENQYLKTLLDNAGIHYKMSVNVENICYTIFINERMVVIPEGGFISGTN